MGIPSAENEAHAAKAGQAFKFLADMRDPYIRAVALDQLRETVAKRARHLDPNKAENLVDFLNNSALPGEGRAADLQSLWSHCRASLIIGGAAIELTQDSAFLLTEKQKLPWGKCKQAFLHFHLHTNTHAHAHTLNPSHTLTHAHNLVESSLTTHTATHFPTQTILTWMPHPT